MAVKLLTEHHLEFLSLKNAQARLCLHLSKYHIPIYLNFLYTGNPQFGTFANSEGSDEISISCTFSESALFAEI